MERLDRLDEAIAEQLQSPLTDPEQQVLVIPKIDIDRRAG